MRKILLSGMMCAGVITCVITVYSANQTIPDNILGEWKVTGYKCDNVESCAPNNDGETVTIAKDRMVMKRGVNAPYTFISPDTLIVETDQYALRLVFTVTDDAHALVKVIQIIKVEDSGTVVASDTERWEKIGGVLSKGSDRQQRFPLSGRYFVGSWKCSGVDCSSEGECLKASDNTLFEFKGNGRGKLTEDNDTIPFEYRIGKDTIKIDTVQDGKKVQIEFKYAALDEIHCLMRIEAIRVNGKKIYGRALRFKRYEKTE